MAAAAGAQVLVRQDAQLRGKGYAVAHAFEESRKRDWAEAVVVIDADSRVSAESAGSHRGAHGARRAGRAGALRRIEHPCLLAYAPHGHRHGRLPPRARRAGRERLGLSCGIRGNGWALTHALLRQVPYASFSLTEDIEYGIELGMRGVRVAYADEAACDGEMVSREKDARSQRRRWEQGRVALLRDKTLPLLKHAVCCAQPRVPGPGAGPAGAAAFVCGARGAGADGGSLAAVAARPLPPAAWFWTGVLSCVALVLYVLRGWQLSGSGLRGLLDLLRAPFFLMWKLATDVPQPAHQRVGAHEPRRRPVVRALSPACGCGILPNSRQRHDAEAALQVVTAADAPVKQQLVGERPADGEAEARARMPSGTASSCSACWTSPAVRRRSTMVTSL